MAATVLLACVTGFPALMAEDSGMVGNSRILGKITQPDGKTAVPDATVVAYHLSSKQFFSSAPSDAKGGYTIADLPAGYYDLAVRTPQGLFVGSSIVNVAPARKSIANFSVVPFGTEAQRGAEQDRTFPGSEGTPSGAAKIDEQLTRREFWRSAKGVAILAGGGTAILLAIVTSDDDETAVSAF